MARGGRGPCTEKGVENHKAAPEIKPARPERGATEKSNTAESCKGSEKELCRAAPRIKPRREATGKSNAVESWAKSEEKPRGFSRAKQGAKPKEIITLYQEKAGRTTPKIPAAPLRNTAVYEGI